MTSSSSRFNSATAAGLARNVALGAGLATVLASGLGYAYAELFALTACVIALTFLFFGGARRGNALTEDQSAEAKVIAKIAVVCTDISQGNFEARIPDIMGERALAEVQHKVNDMIDRCDAFVREATASLEAVCRNIYYRRILLGGMQGSFRVAAQTINDAVTTQERAVEQARQNAAAEQARLISLIAHGLNNLAEGKLTFRLGEFPEAYRQIRGDFNGAMARLEETIRVIAMAANEVASATAEISSGTTDLSQRTEEQAATLEQTSASMEEISATVKKNAENAQAANNSASATREVANHGGQVVTEAIEAMSRIEASSHKIADIIGVIDEIARQTNLLALNAAVEAARAGESGRGFAVVATEVRSLAQRSSQAAKDIKDLIGHSSGQVKQGVELVNRVGGALHDVVESIKGVADLVSAIANASGEQAIGVDEINKALAQMDEVTQQNSALVEESAAAAKTLEQQAHAMHDRIAFFEFDSRTDIRDAVTSQTAREFRPRHTGADVVVPKLKSA